LPSERDLMDQYGVGRPAVREALQAMERSGFVEIAHGERARVVDPTADRLIAQIAAGAQHLLRTKPDMLKHMKEARVFLETSTARMAAERASEEQVARLRQAIAEHRASMVNLEEFIERDMAFHREIADISGNPIFPLDRRIDVPLGQRVLHHPGARARSGRTDPAGTPAHRRCHRRA
jgi:DNA-binding FadR family transcriptional regulator